MAWCLLCALFLIGCRATTGASASSPSLEPSAPVRIDGGDGLGCQNAVVIHTPSDSETVDAAFGWLADRYPGYLDLGASLSPSVVGSRESRVYDLFRIELPSGERKGICFDITESWGK